MKTQILKSIFLFCILHLTICIYSNAQIVYTNIPDTTIISNFSSGGQHLYGLDLNNDGTKDFLIRATAANHSCPTSGYSGSAAAYIEPYNNGINKIANDALNYPRRLDSNVIINNNLSPWRSASAQKLRSVNHLCGTGGTTYLGNWAAPPADKYLAVKLFVGADAYYGWIRLNIIVVWMGVTCFANVTIKDYAYNSIPNQPILAGEISCSNPTVNLTQSGPLSFCAGDSVVLTANGTGYQYQWKKNNVNIAGAKSQTYVAKTADTYKCKVTNSCGSKTSGGKTVTIPCRNTDASFLSMTNNELEHLSVYPNPANNSVTIKFPSDEAGEIEIANLFGQVVFSEKINAEQTTIDVSKFSEGMYVVRWSSVEKIQTKIFSVIK